MNDSINAATMRELQAQIAQLRDELNALQQASSLMLAVILCSCPSDADLPRAVAAVKDMLDQAEDQQPRSELFWDMAAGSLRMLSQRAIAAHPNDPQIQTFRQGVTRPRPQNA